MKILSLFDGISCGRVALERAGINVEEYYASEIDKYAIQISDKNYPDIVRLGSVVDVLFNKALGELFFEKNYKDIDLLIGGSPCQDLSIAGKRKGLSGERSGLFYEYVRILSEVKPKYFILENVASMSKEARETITKELFGIEPVMINASLVSAQNRKRLFWVGKLDEFGTYQKVEIPQPEDKGILLKDILEEEVDIKYYITKDRKNTFVTNRPQDIDNIKAQTLLVGGTLPTIAFPKAYCLKVGGQQGLTERGFNKFLNSRQDNFVWNNEGYIRKLTPIECERLQGLPDNYTEGISNTQRYKTLGNAFNVDVVAHILKYINLT